MVGWHHRLNGHECEQALGVSGGQGSLECCSPWDHTESDMTEWLNWTDWSWSSNTLVTWFEEPTHWKRPWCWERLKAEGKGDDRGWDGWMTSPTWLMGMSLSKLRELVTDREAWNPQSMGLQRAGHNGVSEQQQDGLYLWVGSPTCCVVLGAVTPLCPALWPHGLQFTRLLCPWNF